MGQPLPINVPSFSPSPRKIQVIILLPEDLESKPENAIPAMALGDGRCGAWAGVLAGKNAAWSSITQDPQPNGQCTLVCEVAEDKPWVAFRVEPRVQGAHRYGVCSSTTGTVKDDEQESWEGMGAQVCIPGTVVVTNDHPTGTWYYLWHDGLDDDNGTATLRKSAIHIAGQGGPAIWLPSNDAFPLVIPDALLATIKDGSVIGGTGSKLVKQTGTNDRYLVQGGKKYKFATDAAFTFGHFDPSKVATEDISATPGGRDIPYDATYMG